MTVNTQFLSDATPRECVNDVFENGETIISFLALKRWQRERHKKYYFFYVSFDLHSRVG